ncbi:heavy-metal-associated domain-containing protein [Candidatus Woesearchaeota archaeon]|nr:heavy-metal-associated domain-containing protein [Candidatus Woesearchaeota archaeon]
MKAQLKIQGMHCKSCEALIQDALSELPGFITAKISAAKGEAVIEFDEKQTSLDTIKKIIQKEGYKVK